MNVWHEPSYKSDNKTCEVCLSGAVLAKSFKSKDKRQVYQGKNKPRFTALDNFRMGLIPSGLRNLGVERWMDFKAVKIVDYTDNPAGFKRALRKVARDLAKVGL